MKYTIKIASYKNSKSIFASFIRFQQRFLQGLPKRNSRFSHSEIVFCYNDDPEVLERLKKIENFKGADKNIDTFENRKKDFQTFNIWFSSSEVDGWSRFKFIPQYKAWKKGLIENWVFNELEITKKEYLAMLDYCISQDNNAYGWFSIIFTQGLKTLWFVDRNSPFCSQITLQALQVIGLYAGVNSIETNPGKLSLLVEKIKKDYKDFKNITN